MAMTLQELMRLKKKVNGFNQKIQDVLNALGDGGKEIDLDPEDYDVDDDDVLDEEDDDLDELREKLEELDEANTVAHERINDLEAEVKRLRSAVRKVSRDLAEWEAA